MKMMSASSDTPNPEMPDGSERIAAARPVRTLAFFGHDRSESTIIKRVRTFQANETRVIGFMFRRVRKGVKRVANCETVELGITQDRHYFKRLTNLVLGLVRTVAHRDLLKRCDVIYARNIDMLLLAVLGKMLTRTKAPVVYEALDIREVFIGQGLINRLFRQAERALMRRSSLLVISSPDHMSRYFGPVQSYSGPWYLLENKMSAEQLQEHDSALLDPPPGPPWVIGLFGVLRCPRSLDLLARLAAANPERIAIHLRGTPSETDIPAAHLEELTRSFSNINYFGPYKAPNDLSNIYGQVHFVWSADLLDPTNNSATCLTNRLYEGCYHGAVALANKGTATARKIESDGLGLTFDDPLENSLQDFFDTLTLADYTALRTSLKSLPRSQFVDLHDTRLLLARIDELRARSGRDLSMPDALASGRAS